MDRFLPRTDQVSWREIGISLPNNQRQHRTLHIQKDVLPCALCQLLCLVSAALASFSRMDSISTSCTSSSPPRKPLPWCHARPFEPQSNVIFGRSVNFWRWIPTTWLQERPWDIIGRARKSDRADTPSPKSRLARLLRGVPRADFAFVGHPPI